MHNTLIIVVSIHRVGLACPCLPIHKQGTIVAFDSIVDQTITHFLKNFIILDLSCEDVVEDETSIPTVQHLLVAGISLDSKSRGWLDPHHHPDRLLNWRHHLYIINSLLHKVVK